MWVLAGMIVKAGRPCELVTHMLGTHMHAWYSECYVGLVRGETLPVITSIIGHREPHDYRELNI